MSTALILVDLELDFVEGGSLAVEGGNFVCEQIGSYLDAIRFDESYATIVATKDWHLDPGDHFSETPDYKDSWPAHCVAGTEGAELHPTILDRLHMLDGVFHKGMLTAAYSGFEGLALATENNKYENQVFVGLHQFLQDVGVDAVDVMGIATDYCVKATAIDSWKLGYETNVFVNYCAGVNMDSTLTAIDDMRKLGIGIV